MCHGHATEPMLKVNCKIWQWQGYHIMVVIITLWLADIERAMYTLAARLQLADLCSTLWSGHPARCSVIV